MAVPSPNPKKADLRRQARKARMTFVRGLEDQTRASLEEQLAELLAPVVAGARILAAYVPIGSEISPVPVIQRAQRLGRTIAYPAFDEDGETFRFRSGEPGMPGPHCIMQPSANEPVVEPDLILVPLVACDRAGTRLGQGGGHYDRVLRDAKERGARIIGLGWKVQLLHRIPADDWDVPMDAFACPRFIEEF